MDVKMKTISVTHDVHKYLNVVKGLYMALVYDNNVERCPNNSIIITEALKLYEQYLKSKSHAEIVKSIVPSVFEDKAQSAVPESNVIDETSLDLGSVEVIDNINNKEEECNDGTGSRDKETCRDS